MTSAITTIQPRIRLQLQYFHGGQRTEDSHSKHRSISVPPDCVLALAAQPQVDAGAWTQYCGPRIALNHFPLHFPLPLRRWLSSCVMYRSLRQSVDAVGVGGCGGHCHTHAAGPLRTPGLGINAAKVWMQEVPRIASSPLQRVQVGLHDSIQLLTARAATPSEHPRAKIVPQLLHLDLLQVQSRRQNW